MADLARGVLIAAIVLEAGVLAFLLAVHAPAVRDGAAARGEDALQRLLALAAGVTVIAAVAGLAAGPGAGREHAGWVLAVVAGAGALVLVFVGGARAGAGGPRSAALVAAAAALLVVPALIGNAGDAVAALVVPANVLHVAAAAAWTGGIACLLALAAVPAGAQERTRLLAAMAARFSGIALLAVVAIALSGLVEGLVLVRRIDALVTTGYGRLVSAKALLLCALAALGAFQRGRTLPDLEDAAAGAGDPATASRLLRDVLRAEAALLALVLVATAALAGMAPSRSSGDRVVTRDVRAGAYEVRARVSPASPGDNRITLDMRPRAGVSGVTVSVRQPRLGIPAVMRSARRASAGRFAVTVPLGAPGTWEVTVAVAHDGRADRGTFDVRLR